MKVSREGVVLIKSFEGFRPRAVARPEGGWVIGYGHTASAREGLTVGEADAELLLQYDLLPVVKTLHERVTAPLNQHQFDALASFAFSLGVERFVASDVLARVNAGAAAEAADALFGWPEAPGPDAALRRRAAERALFVAAPEAAVTLADLLSAPLPLPATPVEAPEQPAPEAPQEDARAAAVAHLLGEVEPDPVADPVTQAPETDAVAETRATEPTPAPLPAIDPQLQRYSPYQAAVVGPLPALEAHRAIGALNLSPIAVAPEPASQPVAESPVEAANDVVEAEAPQPVAPPTVEDAAPAAETAAAPADVVEPEPVIESVPEPVVEEASAPVAPAAPELSAPVEPLIVEPVAPEPLVLTPLSEAEAAPEPRPLWTPEQRTFGQAAPAESGDPLFEDGGAATLGPILRHEIDEDGSRGFDWSETGAFLAMGGIGLVSFGAAMAAFRRAGQEGSSGDQTALIGWVLALIALICVGVSTFNLYQKLGRPKAD